MLIPSQNRANRGYQVVKPPPGGIWGGYFAEKAKKKCQEMQILRAGSQHYIVLGPRFQQGGLVLVDDGVGARALLPESVSTENESTAGR